MKPRNAHALIGAATHTPLMAAFVAVELTGDWQLLPLLLAVDAFGWLVARKLSPDALYAIASQMPVPQGAGAAASFRMERKAARRRFDL